MRALAIILLAFLGIFNAVNAQDIFLSTNQSDYYFSTGENAIIPIQINNTYGKQISGNLQYTISQLINQGNVQLSNSNTEEKSLSIDDQNSKVSLNVGKSQTPSNYSVNINYNYNVNGDRIVSLGPISVHFVSNGSNKTQGNAKMQSSSQPNNQPQNNHQDLFSQQQQQMQQRLNQMLGNQQDLFSQQQQQMQQRLNQMLGNPQNQEQNQNQSQNHQQQLQNNQLSQDSNALKHQFEKQVQKQEQVKNEFERKLFSNNDFLNKHQKLLKDGYTINSSDLNPVTNETGTFNIKYNNTNGKWATLQGNMKNGNAQINEQTEQVTLKDGNSNQFNWNLLLILVATIVSVFSIFLVINKINTKNRSVIDRSLKPKSNSFDYITESKKLMQEAIKQQNSGQYKAAFNTAGKSLRFFLTADAAIKREATTQELTQLLQKNRYPLDDIRDCFKITDLVQFARYKPTDNDFKKIVSLIDKLTSFESSNEN